MAACHSGQPIRDSSFCNKYIESENAGMGELCVALGGKPLYRVCDCL